MTTRTASLGALPPKYEGKTPVLAPMPSIMGQDWNDMPSLSSLQSNNKHIDNKHHGPLVSAAAAAAAAAPAAASTELTPTEEAIRRFTTAVGTKGFILPSRRIVADVPVDMEIERYFQPYLHSAVREALDAILKNSKLGVSSLYELVCLNADTTLGRYFVQLVKLILKPDLRHTVAYNTEARLALVRLLISSCGCTFTTTTVKTKK